VQGQRRAEAAQINTAEGAVGGERRGRADGRTAELARRCGRYGYRRITALLRNAGWAVTRKRVELASGMRLWI
jgi:hypothetical protein